MSRFKNKEKEEINIYENILNKVNLFENDEEDEKVQKFLFKLFCNLSIMNFHCI